MASTSAPYVPVDSLGSVTPIDPSLTRGQVSNGPSWYACEDPGREPDVFAVWHASGCDLCAGRVRELVVANGPAEFPDRLAWLTERVEH